MTPVPAPSATIAEAGPSSHVAISIASSALQETDHRLALRLQKELDRQENTQGFENNPGQISHQGAPSDGSFEGFEDDKEDGGTSALNFGGTSTSDSSLASISSDTESDDDLMGENEHDENSGLSNRPPGAPKDWGIDLNSLKARRRQATSHAKIAAKYDKGHNVEVFKVGSIVSVKIPPKDRPTGVDNRRLFARVLKMKRNTYQLQTDAGILQRYYHTRDHACLPPALARHIDRSIPSDIYNEVSMRAAARKSSSAHHERVVCRCKGMCSNNRCSCKKNGKKCTIYCHKGTRDCGLLAMGPEFSNYALIPRHDKGKDRE